MQVTGSRGIPEDLLCQPDGLMLNNLGTKTVQEYHERLGE